CTFSRTVFLKARYLLIECLQHFDLPFCFVTGNCPSLFWGVQDSVVLSFDSVGRTIGSEYDRLGFLLNLDSKLIKADPALRIDLMTCRFHCWPELFWGFFWFLFCFVFFFF
ncbi:hypothetical protein Nmel_011195, partial [Mimus melanotis]